MPTVQATLDDAVQPGGFHGDDADAEDRGEEEGELGMVLILLVLDADDDPGEETAGQERHRPHLQPGDDHAHHHAQPSHCKLY